MRRWEEIFPESDRAVMQKAGFGVRQEFGSKPAFLIIDVSWGGLGSTSRPVMDAIDDEHPLNCGEAGWQALTAIQKLLQPCRDKHIPVFFTTGDPALRRLYFPSGAVKSTMRIPASPTGDEIPEQIAPLPSELHIRKAKPSAFFGTPLLLCLQSVGIDSLLVAGATTSGCVRASVIDACSYGFRCFVVEECCFDRIELSHLVNLFEMNAKYADVITLDEALQSVDQLPLHR